MAEKMKCQKEGCEREALWGADYCWEHLVKQGLDKENLWKEKLLANIDSLKAANLQESEFGQANFREAKLKRANLKKAILQSADLELSDLRDANLLGAKLIFANLQKAQLQCANFQEADLYLAKFQESFMAGADLRGADLRYANFKAANLIGIKYTKLVRLPRSIRNLIVKLKQVSIIKISWLEEFYERIKAPTLWEGSLVDSVDACDPLVLRYIKDQSWLEAKLEESSKSWWGRLWMFLWGISSGYGTNIWLWIFWSCMIAIGFGLAYLAAHWLGHDLVKIVAPLSGDPGWFTYFYFSIVTFTTFGFGDVVPVNTIGQIIVALEVICGYVMLGGLISIFTNKLARLS